MTKGEMIDEMEPFMDETRIIVKLPNGQEHSIKSFSYDYV